MEDDNKKETVEDEKIEGTGENDNSQKKDDVEDTIQKRADAIVAKKMKNMPSKEELKAFRDWQDKQKSADTKAAEAESKYRNALSDNEQLQNENAVLKSGVNVDDADYVLFKVSKMEGDFSDNLKSFLKDNPKYLKSSETKIVRKVGSSSSLTGSDKKVDSTNAIMNDLIRSAKK